MLLKVKLKLNFTTEVSLALLGGQIDTDSGGFR